MTVVVLTISVRVHLPKLRTPGLGGSEMGPWSLFRQGAVMVQVKRKVVTGAVRYALSTGIVGVDAIRLILQQRLEKPVDLFCLDGRPHLIRGRGRQAKRLLAGRSFSVVILGGAHNLADNLDRLSAEKIEYVRVATKRWKEYAQEIEDRERKRERRSPSGRRDGKQD